MKTQAFETLVVGVDFSPYSKIVVRQAIDLAPTFGARLILVHAFPKWPTDKKRRADSHDLSLSDRKELKESVARFYKIENSSNVEIRVAQGPVPSVILKIADQVNKPLILVGSQGRNAISRFLLGTHAEKIALESPYPVWIHRGREIVPFHKLLVPTDLSEASRRLIQQIRSWPQDLRLKVRYLFVRPLVLPLLDSTAYQAMSDEVHESVKSSIRDFNRKGPSVPIATISGDDPSWQISQVGEKYDVIAMNPHDHPGEFHSFGHVTSKVIRSSQKPVLVCRT